MAVSKTLFSIFSIKKKKKKNRDLPTECRYFSQNYKIIYVGCYGSKKTTVKKVLLILRFSIWVNFFFCKKKRLETKKNKQNKVFLEHKKLH